MNVIILLDQDHRKVLEMVEQLSKTTSRAKKKREDLFYKIHTELAIHETFEEKILYPALKKKDTKLILESFEEHHCVDRIIEELIATPADDERWLAKLMVMQENLKHHIKEERKAVFPLAKKTFDAATLEQMASQMQELKESMKGKTPEAIRGSL
jgi:hemerythrin-like domain-containing protein